MTDSSSPTLASLPPPPSSSNPAQPPASSTTPLTAVPSTLVGSSAIRSSSVPRFGGVAGGGQGGLARAGSTGSSAARPLLNRPDQGSGETLRGGEQEVNGHHVDIDKIIQMATSHSPRPGSAQPHHPFPLRSGTPTQHMQPSQSSLGQDTRMCLFVGNLPFRVRWQDVKDLFRRAGTVLRADVSLGSDNRSRGHGTVLMGSREDGLRAVEMFNGYNWQTRVLEVRPDRLPPEFELHAGQPPPQAPHPQHPSFLHPPPPHHLMPQGFSHPGSRSASPYYGNGPPPNPSHYAYPPPPHPFVSAPLSRLAGAPSSSSQNLLLVPSSVVAAASLHGTPPANASASLSSPIASTSALPTPPLPSSSSPINYTPTIASDSLATTALTRNPSKSPTDGTGRAPPPPHLGSLPPPPAFGQVGHSMQQAHSQQQQPLHGQGAVSPSGGMRLGSGNLAGRVLFVGNLPYHIQWQDLKDLFRAAGNIIRADVVLGPDGRSKGIGHVLFATEEDAARGIKMFDAVDFNGRILQVRLETNVVPNGNGPPPPPRLQIPPPQQQQQRFQHQQQQQGYPPFPLPSPRHQVPSMNFPLYGYEPPSPFHPPPSPFYPPPSPFHAPFQYQQHPPPSTASNGATGAAEKEGEKSTTVAGQPRTPPRGSHHPGPISLPPAYPAFGGLSSGPGSPMLGRNGLPMMTPSMPSFQFGGHFTTPQTPEFYPHAFLSPGLGPMSPDPSSPNHPSSHASFYHHHSHNPFLNPAPGAPISRFPGPPPLGATNQSNPSSHPSSTASSPTLGHGGFDNPMFPSSPQGYNARNYLHQRMETPGAVYFPGGGNGNGVGRQGSSFGTMFEEAGLGREDGKTPHANGNVNNVGSAGSAGGESSGGYPFPHLLTGESETPGLEGVVSALRKADLGAGERPRSGGEVISGEAVEGGGGGERPVMGSRSMSRRNSGGGA